MLGCCHVFFESKMVVTKSFQDKKMVENAWQLPKAFWISILEKDDAIKCFPDQKS